ncbi:MAG: DUF2780 domain-containing protein [Burkholderiales bacterium]
MNRRQFLYGSLVLAAALQGCGTMESGAGSASALTNSLTSQLGVTSQQASAGVGSMLNYAKGKLSPDQWSSLSKSMPGADSYLRSASDALGTGNITSTSGLNSAFSKLGMSPDMVNKFKPIISDYAGKYGGSAVKSALAGVF